MTIICRVSEGPWNQGLRLPCYNLSAQENHTCRKLSKTRQVDGAFLLVSAETWSAFTVCWSSQLIDKHGACSWASWVLLGAGSCLLLLRILALYLALNLITSFVFQSCPGHCPRFPHTSAMVQVHLLFRCDVYCTLFHSPKCSSLENQL